ncbi:AvrD family protein [Nocardia sp. NPDC050175]|uniref:AvrD family protein n=1 Tax=Nocardia sp. NPDC050175 TaxID=3364317 RepID=UPI0037A3B53B
MIATPLLLDTVDDYLGPARERFFGHGYSRIRYSISASNVVSDTVTPAVKTTATVHYPTDWSKKAGTDQRPHLSTIDGLLLGQLACEGAAGAIVGLSDDEIAASWIQSVRIRAAKSPDEDLADLPITVTPQRAMAVDATRTYDVQVGGMRLTYTLQHPAASLANPEPPHRDRDTPTPAAITDVHVDREQHTAQAVLTRGDTAELLPEAILGSRYQNSPAFVDGFVAALQLGQILLYELDHMSRADSNTLWMRNTVLIAAAPRKENADKRMPISTHLDNQQKITLAEKTWRTVDIVGELSGMSVRCSVAHQLPDSTTN